MRKILFCFYILLSINIFADRLYPFPQDGKWGYIDQTGKVIVAPVYNSAEPFFSGMGKIAKVNDRDEYLYGFVDISGREVIPPKFITVSDFEGGVARAKIRNKYVYLLTNGVLVTKNEFDEIYPATNGISVFKQGEKYGYANLLGEIIIQAKFTRTYNFSECGLAVVSTNDRNFQFGVIDRQGRFIIQPQYNGIKNFVNGFSGVRKNRIWQVIDKNGVLVSDKEFEAVGEFSNGLINVRKNNKWGFMDSAGIMVIEAQFAMADRFSKGLAIVSDGKLYGYINTSGRLISSYVFTRVTRFDGKLARVAQGRKNGFMNSEGRFNLTDKINSIGSFYSGRARMKVGNYYGYYGQDAKLAIKPSFLHVSDFKDNLAITIAPIIGGYQVAYINTAGMPVKSWSVLSKPILKNKDIFYSIIYPSVPFYKESDPNSLIIIRANYGNSFIKSHQQTATPINGHGLSGFLYSAEYYARPGFVFSEVVSLYAPPKIGMGISSYFREYFGVVFETDSPTAYQKNMNTVFFNGATLQRKISRASVDDTYFIPFMKVSESFFLLVAALGNPVAQYPENLSGALPNYLSNKEEVRFSGRKDSEDNPLSFILTKGRSRVNVSKAPFGVNITYSYPKPVGVSGAFQEPVFTVDDKNLEVLLQEEEQVISTNIMQESLSQITTNSNDSQTEIIIEQVKTTNAIDLTDAILLDIVNSTNQQQNAFTNTINIISNRSFSNQ